MSHLPNAPAKPTVLFRLDLPEGFRTADALAYHGRDPLSLTERVEGATLHKALVVEGGETVLSLDFQARAVLAGATGPMTPALQEALQHRAERMLGLASDPAPFERSVAGDPAFTALIAPRLGLRIPLTADVWESLVWAILGQQVNLAFAYTMRRRLTELCGGAINVGLRSHPTPEAVAALDPSDLLPLQFSRSKAAYVIGAARLVAEGALPVEAFPGGDPLEAAASLGAVRGIGPWTTHYVLMRGCGFPDCVPLGDAGLTLALQRHHALDHRPGVKETAALMAAYAPFRSLATFHLWASLKGVPA
jgi:3-methyladenine DNA glycosylase/8-oxoguanine DNA glycosylase